MSIVSIEPAFKLITDPDGKRAEFKERFQRECNYEDTPLQALQVRLFFKFIDKNKLNNACIRLEN